MEEKYSVLMSVYYKERPEYLKIAIESMLHQTVAPNEFILVKDGPLTPELEAVISKFEAKNPGVFKVIANPVNLGLGPALREGILEARNELIARMDSDDYSVPNRCEKQLTHFRSDKDLGMIGCFEAEFIDSTDNVVSIHKVPENNDQIVGFMRRRCAMLHPTVMYKKSAVIRAGNYQEKSNYAVYEDYDLFTRMIFDAKVKCYNIQESLYYIRTSEDFYARRGGVKYAKTVLRFKWNLFSKGQMSLGDFVVSGIGQAAVCLLPNAWRKAFYMGFLRN